MFWSQDNKRDAEKSKASDDHYTRLLIFMGIVFVIIAVQQKLSRMSPEELFWLKVKAVLFVGSGIVAVIWFIRWKKNAPKRAKRRQLRPIWLRAGQMPVGITPSGVELGIPDHVRTGHVQIIGATGRGKTESVILPWASFDASRNKNVLLIDGKGDVELYNRLTQSMHKQERYVFNLAWAKDKKPFNVINPLMYGTAQQITDRLFTAFEFDDPYYRAVQYSLVGVIVKLIKENPERKGEPEGVVTFKRIYELLTDEGMLRDVVSKSKNDFDKRKVLDFLNDKREDRLQKISGFLAQIEPFAIGEVSKVVNAEGKEDGFISISRLVLGLPDHWDTRIPGYFQRPFETRRCYAFLLSTLLYQKISHQIGKLLLQELGWAIGEREASGKNLEFMPVYLDEFSSFVYKGFENILNKARSANVALHLSHQSLGDLRMVSPDFATVINSNTNIKCILGVNDPETAEHFARHLGTETELKMTERANKTGFFKDIERTGEMSLREVESYKVHPNELKHFSKGRGVFHVPIHNKTFTEVVDFHNVHEMNEARMSMHAG